MPVPCIAVAVDVSPNVVVFPSVAASSAADFSAASAASVAARKAAWTARASSSANFQLNDRTDSSSNRMHLLVYLRAERTSLSVPGGV